MCYMVQGDDPLEVNSDSKFDEDIDMSYDDLALLCHKLLKKYDLLKKENDFVIKENETLLNENVEK